MPGPQANGRHFSEPRSTGLLALAALAIAPFVAFDICWLIENGSSPDSEKPRETGLECEFSTQQNPA